MSKSTITKGLLRWCWVAMVFSTVLASQALAQLVDNSLVLPPDVEVRARGWLQLSNTREMVDFAVTLLETTLLTAMIAFHPANAGREIAADTVDMRKGLFLFAFIGMLTGFLVVHHGYLIGFVIFGIGSLLRFRMDSISISDTGQLVIVSLIGLSSGLDLPVMSLIATTAAWAVIWLFGRAQTLVLEVKFDDEANVQKAMRNLREQLNLAGFQIGLVSKTKFKPTAQYSLLTQERNAKMRLVDHMSEYQSDRDNGIADWHVD